jgi:hypothetical protein
MEMAMMALTITLYDDATFPAHDTPALPAAEFPKQGFLLLVSWMGGVREDSPGRVGRTQFSLAFLSPW